MYISIYTYANEISDWSSVSTTSNTCKKSSASCYIYVCVSDVPVSLQKALEKEVGGTESPGASDDKGKIRYNSLETCMEGSIYPQENSPIN